MRLLKNIIMIILLLFVLGCSSCETPKPIDYVNFLETKFGVETKILQTNFQNSNSYYIKDEVGDVWLIVLSHESEEEGPRIYIWNKVPLFVGQ